MPNPSRRHWGFIRSSLPPVTRKEHCTTGQKEEWGWRVGRDGADRRQEGHR